MRTVRGQRVKVTPRFCLWATRTNSYELWWGRLQERQMEWGKSDNEILVLDVLNLKCQLNIEKEMGSRQLFTQWDWSLRGHLVCTYIIEIAIRWMSFKFMALNKITRGLSRQKKKMITEAMGTPMLGVWEEEEGLAKVIKKEWPVVQEKNQES